MPKRVALIGNQAFSMLNFRGRLIHDIVAKGHEVYAFAPDFDESSRAAIGALGARPIDHGLHRTGMNPVSDVAGVVDLVAKLRTIRPDIAIGYSIKPATYGVLAGWAAGVPRQFAMIEGLGHIFVSHSSPKARALRATVSLLYRSALHRAERTFFLNADDRADFLELGLVDAARSEVIGAIGVDLGEWRPAVPVMDPMTFLFVGRLLREKGLLELIEAARTVKSSHPETRFILLGDVDSNPSSVTRAEVESWVAEGLVTWPGQVDVAPWIAKSSVFVLPSYREGVPRSTQEAMAMARPVITTDVPGCRETVIHRRNGFLVPPRNSDAIARAMLEFLCEPQLVATMGLVSREIAEAKFDVTHANARLMDAMTL